MNGAKDTWLLAVDGSQGANDAARYAARVAKAFGAGAVRIVNARLLPVSVRAMSQAVLRAQARQDGERITATARRILGFAEFDCSAQYPIGDDPAAMIVSAAEAVDAAEIVMGTRGMSMLSSITLGSVAYKVVHMARRSVTLVPTRSRTTGRQARNPLSMLVAVDGSAAANRAVQHAARQAAHTPKARIVLLNVQPRIVSENVRRFVSRAQIDGYTEAQARTALRQGERLLVKAGVRYEVRIATGEPVASILAAAADADCGRIVVGTRGRGAAKSLLLGSVAYGLVHHADVPVTVVKQALPAPVVVSR